MAIKKPCTHGKVLCGLYRGTRQFAHKADHFLRDYGADIGKTAQALAAPISAAGFPEVGLVAGAVGKGIQTYADVRNQMG